jgi:Nucleosome assembly protein (NAP)
MTFQLFAEGMNENDMAILDKLQDIKCEMLEPSPDEAEDEKTWGYKLTFVFAANEFFEETELTKTYFFHDAEESDLKKTEGFKINWKPGEAPSSRLPGQGPCCFQRVCLVPCQ